MAINFNLSQNSKACAILLLLVGVVFNIISFFQFKYSTSKRIEEAVLAINVSSIKLYDDVLRRIDDRLQSISTNTFDTVDSSIPLKDTLSTKSSSPLLPVIDSIDYDYYVSDGRHIARIRSQDFSDGSPYPRGGVITRVYADCLVIDGKYLVSRSSSSYGGSRSSAPVPASSFDFSDLNKQLKDI